MKTGFCRLLFKKCVYCKHLDIFSVEILRLLPACPPSGDGRIFPYTVIPQEAELKATQSSQVAWANQSKHVIAQINAVERLVQTISRKEKEHKTCGKTLLHFAAQDSRSLALAQREKTALMQNAGLSDSKNAV